MLGGDARGTDQTLHAVEVQQRRVGIKVVTCAIGAENEVEAARVLGPVLGVAADDYFVRI